MSVLRKFEGSWREVSSEGNNEFLKAMGLNSVKRVIAKLLTTKLKYEILADDEYVLTEGSNPARKIRFGVRQEVDANLGLHYYVVELDETNWTLCATVTIIKPRSDLKNLKEGDTVNSRTRMTAEGKIESRIRYGEAEMVKLFEKE